MTYREEFDDYPADAMPALPPQWEDASWHNDACPCFERELNGARAYLYLDYPDPKDREFPEAPRFLVRHEPSGAYLASDDLDECLTLVDRWALFT